MRELVQEVLDDLEADGIIVKKASLPAIRETIQAALDESERDGLIVKNGKTRQAPDGTWELVYVETARLRRLRIGLVAKARRRRRSSRSGSHSEKRSIH
jgi:hypothetical protein